MQLKTVNYKMKALTPIWTGNAYKKGDKLKNTGLLGSIRWWFEVVVRGLGGYACDPLDSKKRCPDDQGRRCVVCEFFGCTGWARKFRFEVMEHSDNAVQDERQEHSSEFTLRFTPLRPIEYEEWALLDLTLRLIADYGAIGGRIALKPSDEPNRATLPHHRDYGIIQIVKAMGNDGIDDISRAELETYVCDHKRRQGVNKDGFAWASLQHFWCVPGKHLARQSADKSTFNKILGRKEGKKESNFFENNNDKISKWLTGGQKESKKVFSFKNPARTFGFVKPGLLTVDEMKQRLLEVWTDLKDDDFLTGKVILDKLLSKGSGRDS